MMATNHGLFGSTIAIVLQKHPAVAIAISPFSHFLLDAIPHFGGDNLDLRGREFAKLLIFDATLAVASTLAVAWFWPDIALLVVVCAFLAASPDLMWIYYEYINPKLRHKHLVPKFHTWIQWSQTPNGAIVEMLWFMVLFPTLILIGLYA